MSDRIIVWRGQIGTGPQGAPGAPLFTTGDWDLGLYPAGYDIGWVVGYLGSSFASKIDGNMHTPPATPTSDAYWGVVAAIGNDGVDSIMTMESTTSITLGLGVTALITFSVPSSNLGWILFASRIRMTSYSTPTAYQEGIVTQLNTVGANTVACKLLITNFENTGAYNDWNFSIAGEPGKEVELQNTGTYVQWRLVGGVWENLIELATLKATQLIRKHDYQNPIDYCGYADIGSAESDAVWVISKIVINLDGTVASVTTLANQKWSDRYTIF